MKVEKKQIILQYFLFLKFYFLNINRSINLEYGWKKETK